MAEAATGPQFLIRPWALGLELLVYLASAGVGTYVVGATVGNTLYLGRMPETPEACSALVPDPSPVDWGLSRPHYTLYLRHTSLELGAARAARAFEALHHQSPSLPSYHLFIECDGLPSAFNFNANNRPVHVLGFRTAGMVRRA